MIPKDFVKPAISMKAAVNRAKKNSIHGLSVYGLLTDSVE